MLLGGERVLRLEVEIFPEDFVYDKSTGHYNKTRFEQLFMIILNFNFPKHFFSIQ